MSPRDPQFGDEPSSPKINPTESLASSGEDGLLRRVVRVGTEVTRVSSPAGRVKPPSEQRGPAPPSADDGPTTPRPAARSGSRGGGSGGQRALRESEVPPPPRRIATEGTSEGAPRAVREKRGERPEERIGQVLGSYRLVELIGKGGMGFVYRAEHIKLGREVALKLLRSDYAQRRDSVARFFQEARAVNRIRHRNIVDVTDFVELEDGTTFIIMELLRGFSLGRWARSGLELPRALGLLIQICEGLSAAHGVGIVHRDLKPDNVIVVPSSDGAEAVKLLDFGVAKLLHRDDEDDDYGLETAAGSVIGTPAYMSPEQAGGMPVDARSDIYSLGAIMYEMFCGQPLFRARSFGEYVRKHLVENPARPRDTEGGAAMDDRLEAMLLRCLEKDPDKRYNEIHELRDELLELLATIDTGVLSVSGRSRVLPLPLAAPSTGIQDSQADAQAQARSQARSGSHAPGTSSGVPMARPGDARTGDAGPGDVGGTGGTMLIESISSVRVPDDSAPVRAAPPPLPLSVRSRSAASSSPGPLRPGPIEDAPETGLSRGDLPGGTVAMRPRIWPWLLVAMAVGGGAVTIFLALRDHDVRAGGADGPSSVAVVAAAGLDAVSLDVRDPAHGPVATLPALAERQAPPSDAGAAPVPASSPLPVTVRFEAKPGAKLYSVGARNPLCSTPCSITIDPRDGGSLSQRDYLLRRRGYRSERVTIDLSAPATSVHRDLVRRRKDDPPEAEIPDPDAAAEPGPGAVAGGSSPGAAADGGASATSPADPGPSVPSGTPDKSDKPDAGVKAPGRGDSPDEVDPTDTMDPFGRR